MIKVGDYVKGINGFACLDGPIKPDQRYRVVARRFNGSETEFKLENQSFWWNWVDTQFAICLDSDGAEEPSVQQIPKRLGAAAKIAADRAAQQRDRVAAQGLDWAFKQKRTGFLCSARNAVMGEAIERAVVVDRKLGLRK